VVRGHEPPELWPILAFALRAVSTSFPIASNTGA
jgi:hypothetical protein